MFQINTKEVNLVELINNSTLTKKEIAKKANITVQWLNKLLSKPIKELTIQQYDTLLEVLGYESIHIINRIE